LAGNALLHSDDGAAAVALYDRDVEPGPLREQFEIALRIALKLREPEQKKGGRRHPDRRAGQRLRAARQILADGASALPRCSALRFDGSADQSHRSSHKGRVLVNTPVARSSEARTGSEVSTIGISTLCRKFPRPKPVGQLSQEPA